MLTIEQRIIENLRDRVNPISQFAAISGVVDTQKGLAALDNLVRLQIIEMCNMPLSNRGRCVRVPMYRYTAPLPAQLSAC